VGRPFTGLGREVRRSARATLIPSISKRNRGVALANHSGRGREGAGAAPGFIVEEATECERARQHQADRR
jgi:hypothetical protein